MALKDILADIASDIGPSLNVASERALVIARINRVAEELYKEEDLMGSLKEQVFSLDTATQQVTLPYYVGELRAMRYYDARIKVTLVDQQPRYHYGMGNEVWPLVYRVLNKCPLHTTLENESTLTIKSPLASLETFTVTIVGKTPNAARVAETLSFAVGDLEHETTNNFEEVFSVEKNTQTSFDLQILDADDTELGTIPNVSLSSAYINVQVLDSETSNNNAVEVLYKNKLFPLVNDYDEFVMGNIYDKAVYWKYLEFEAARNKDINGAIAAKAQANMSAKKAAEDIAKGFEKPIDCAPDPLLTNPSLYAYPLSNRLYWP